MKKVFALILALALVFSAAPAFAAENPTGQDSVISFIYAELDNGPTYWVSIPTAIDIVEGGSSVEVTASEVTDLEGQKISVTFAGTDGMFDHFLLSGISPDNMTQSASYFLTTAGGEELKNPTGLSVNPHVGKELVSFLDSGVATFGITPVLGSWNDRGTTYTGTITFGFGLVEA